MASEIDIYERLAAMALPAAERNELLTWDQVITPDTVAEIPNPYRVIENKDELIGVPFFVREAVFNEPNASDYDNDYVILYIVTQTEMVILTDGGTGIRDQIKNIVNKRLDQRLAEPTQGFFFPNGLRVSEYQTIELPGERPRPLKKGEEIPKDAKKGKGATYYFA